MKNRIPSVLNLGLPSILTVFLVLSLITFATLSLVTSRFAYNRSQQRISRVRQLNEAYNDSEATLALVDQILADTRRDTTLQDWYEAANAPLTELDGVTTHYRDEQFLITWQTSISDVQHLEVCLRVGPPAPTDSYYEILRWAACPSQAWEDDTNLSLYRNNE